MENWITIRPGILALLASLSDVPSGNITWEDQPRPFTNDATRAQILCSIGSVQAQGQDSCSTVFQGFASSVVASKFQGTATDGQSLWFTENAPAPFALNVEYFARDIVGSTFKLSATPGGSVIAPTLSSSTGAVLATVEPGAELLDVSAGIRLFLLTLKCESFDESDGRTAYQYLEQLRARLWRKSSVDALLALNICCFETNDQTQDTSGPIDGRMVSKAQLVIHVRAAIEEPGDAYGYIVSTSTTGSVSP